MSEQVRKQCCWCGEKIRGHQNFLQPEKRLSLLLNLLSLSVSNVENGKAAQFCSRCNDLVDSGVAYRRNLEEVIVLLRRRSSNCSKDSKSRRKRKVSVTGNGFTLTVGERFSKCFIQSFVQLESLDPSYLHAAIETEKRLDKNDTLESTVVLSRKACIQQEDSADNNSDPDGLNGSHNLALSQLELDDEAVDSIKVLEVNDQEYEPPCKKTRVEIHSISPTVKVYVEPEIELIDEEGLCYFDGASNNSDCREGAANRSLEPVSVQNIQDAGEDAVDDAASFISEAPDSSVNDEAKNLKEAFNEQTASDDEVRILESDGDIGDDPVFEMGYESAVDSNDESDPTFRPITRSSATNNKGPQNGVRTRSRAPQVESDILLQQREIPPPDISVEPAVADDCSCAYCRFDHQAVVSEEAQELEPLESLRCVKCSDELDNSPQFKAHVNIHLLDGKASEICNFQPEKSEHDCILCDYSTPNLMVIPVHLNLRHNLVQRACNETFYYLCKACGAPFESANLDLPTGEILRDDLDAMKAFSTEHADCKKDMFKDFVCRKCHATFSTFVDLRQHQHEKHPFQLQCRFCSSKFFGYPLLKKHLETEHAQPFTIEYKCNRCWKEFPTFDELHTHLSQFGQVEPLALKSFAGYPCLSCGLFFDSTALLVVHMQECHNSYLDLTFDCLRCSQTLQRSEFTTSSETGSATYLLNRKDKGGASFKTFTALCAQHFQDCMTLKKDESCSKCLAPSFNCYVCKETCKSLQDLAAHLNEHIGVKRLFKCPACTYISNNDVSHRRHLLKAHRLETFGTNFYYCSICLESWKPSSPRSSLEDLRDDKDILEFLQFAEGHSFCRKTRQKTFKCSSCSNFRASAPVKLFKHWISKHTKTFPVHCDLCGYALIDQATLYNHLKTKCKNGPSRKENAANTRIVEDKYKYYECQECDYRSRHLWRLKQHEANHKVVTAGNEAEQESLAPSPLPFVCEKCGSGFASSKALKIHHTQKHSHKQLKKTLPCGLCGKMFTSIKSMRAHLYQHNKQPTIPKKSNRKLRYPDETEEERMERLKRVRKGKPKLCCECGKLFPSNQGYANHMLVHKGEHTFVCEQCGRGFNSPTALHCHKKLHQENRERNIPCPQCDKKFFTKANADQHVRVFHNKLPWPGKIRSYKKWKPKNPEALAAAGIEYQRQDTDNEDSD